MNLLYYASKKIRNKQKIRNKNKIHIYEEIFLLQKIRNKNKIRIYEEIFLLHIRAGIIITKCSDTRVHVSLAF